MKNYIAVVAGFLVTLFANTFLAMFVLSGFSSDFGISRTMEQGLNFPALLIGYFLVGVFMTWLTKKIENINWIKTGLQVGLMTALAFNVAGYMVISGWSVAHGGYMLFAACVDSVATILGALTISFTLHRK
jgi:hypothetical protein